MESSMVRVSIGQRVRSRRLWRVGLAMIAMGGLLRVILALRGGLAARLPDAVPVLIVGAVVDALVTLALLAPILAWVAAFPPRRLRPRLRRMQVFGLLWAFAFLTVVEFFFFEEFDARFNHLVLDYVLFPGEVAGNIWESYPVPVYLAATGLLAWLSAVWVERGVYEYAGAPGSRRVRWMRAALISALGFAAGIGAYAMPAPDGGDRLADELASNDLVALARAVRTASLDYESYYRTVPLAEARARAARQLGWPDQETPEREFVAHERRQEPLDVVVILGESFGSQFVGRLGGDTPCAPNLERWAQEGLLLTNLVATGNRTVRGLEGVLCSFVPLPGDSIWKRDKSHGVATIAGVLGRLGYRTEFLYGGDGAFDSMRSFALDNGWTTFLGDSLVGGSSYPDDAFRTIWGVADEYLFDALLERQRAAERDGARFFGTALTVSNHKPFLTPDTVDRSLRSGALTAELPWICGLLATSLACAWFLRRRWGVAPTLLALLGTWGVAALMVWTEIKPRDSRAAAVAYADRALSDYLDRAQAEGLLEHTVVLFVGDHGARVYGSEQIPAASYRVPGLFLVPGGAYRGRTIDRLCSQVDLAPTLLSLAGVDYRAPFFGQDLLAVPPDSPGRAWLIHNRDVGLLTDEVLVVLGLQRRLFCYSRDSRDSDRFEPAQASAPLQAAADDGAAVFQIASALYESGRYRLCDGP